MGGVAGHMAHLSEDLDLKFSEIISILGKVANAEITNATEKVDGQNLFLSWTLTPEGEVEVARAGDARTARNAGDIKKGGMTTDEYISKWAGHPAENAFTNGFKAVSAALRGLSPEDLEAIFANGQRYVNMEIMYPKNPNIILYSSPNVVLHGLQDFGEEDTTPEMRQLTKQKFAKLVSLIDGAVQKVGNEQWSIHGPKIVALKKLADGAALETVTSKIESFAAPVGMNATLGDYVEQVVRGYAKQVNLPEEITDKLILLMLQPEEAKERGITVVNLKKGLPKELQTTVSMLGSKTKSRKYIASVLKPLEIAISDFAIEVLRGVKSYFVSDNDEEVARMRAELEQSIAYLKNLQASGDEKMGELIDQQLAKLGSVENLASSMEGIVFEYPPGSDKIYKLTGAFAMANQIIGRARRSGMTEELEDESDDPVVDANYSKKVAVVPGAFKPPHKGHLDMVQKYSSMADEVVVIISKPTKQARTLPNGREITAEDSLKIWNTLVANLPNVEVRVSKDHASPINAAYEYVGDEGSLNVGDSVFLGCSSKDCDWKRWAGAEKYIKQGVELLPPEGTAVEPAVHSPEYVRLLIAEFEKKSDLYLNMPSVKAGKDPKQFHASDFRYILVESTKNDIALKMLPDFIGEENVDAVLSILDLNTPVDEAAVGGYAAPLAFGSDDDPEDKNERKKRTKYIDLSLIDEVMELIMNRGITK